MIDFARVREAVPLLTEAEFERTWTALGEALRTVAAARRRHNIAVLAIRHAVLGGRLDLVSFEGLCCPMVDRP